MIKFALRNEYNQEFALNTLKSTYMPNPSGLGYSLSGEYTRIAHGWVSGGLADDQPEMSGDIYFQSDDAFKSFSSFMKFVRMASKLKFVYQNTAGEYLRDVDIIGVEHSGMVGVNTVKCTVTMAARSLWYLNSVTNYTISSIAPDAMRYAYRFPGRFRGTVNGEIEIVNNGSVEAPFTVSFTGPISNPSVSLRQNGVETARMEILGEAARDESIELSTVDGDLYCYLKTAEGKTNLTERLNIENDNFFKIPVGTSTIKLDSDGEITQPIKVTVKKLFRAV